ncbi:MAG: hypothetical protein AAFP90_14865, partial [Planctomycetota bacterium]
VDLKWVDPHGDLVKQIALDDGRSVNAENSSSGTNTNTNHFASAAQPSAGENDGDQARPNPPEDSAKSQFMTHEEISQQIAAFRSEKQNRRSASKRFASPETGAEETPSQPATREASNVAVKHSVTQRQSPSQIRQPKRSASPSRRKSSDGDRPVVRSNPFVK